MIGKGKIRIFCWLLVIGGFFICPNYILAASGDILINEIMTGQTGATKNEFIELYNSTENSIDLDGYKLKKKTKSGTQSNLVSSSKFIGIIPAQGYFLIAHPDYTNTISADLAYSGSSYSIANNNTIILYDPEDNIIDKVGYGEAADFENQATSNPEKDQSIERQPAGQDSDNNSVDFVIQTTPNPQNSSDTSTPDQQADDGITTGGAPTPPNQPPQADAGTDITALINQEISFDASLSSDPNNDTLTFFWNFGDGATDTKEKPTHTYTYPGQYLVSLLVSDGTFSDLDIVTVSIYSPSVIINEFNNQWIELYNQSDQMANLTNWQLNDFVFPPNSLIGPNQFLVLTKQITKIALDDNNDQVKLIYPDGSISTEVNYLAEDKKDFCIAFDGTGYFWTKVATPGAVNIISALGLEKETDYQTNNPEPIIQETQEPQVLATPTNLTQSQNFETQNPSTTSVNNLLAQSPQNILQNNPSDTQPASLVQKTQSNDKANLILYLSIIISASLLLSWTIIQVKKRTFTS